MNTIVCKKCKKVIDVKEFFNGNGFCQNCGNNLGIDGNNLNIERIKKVKNENLIEKLKRIGKTEIKIKITDANGSKSWICLPITFSIIVFTFLLIVFAHAECNYNYGKPDWLRGFLEALPLFILTSPLWVIVCPALILEGLEMHEQKKSGKYVPYVQNSNWRRSYQAYDDPFDSIGSLILLLIPGGFIIVLLGLLF